MLIPGAFKYSSVLSPMLASSAKEPFDSNEYIFELKYDGYRALAEKTGNKVRLYSRHGTSFDKAYPKIVKELERVTESVVLDGEIVVLEKDGRPSFQSLQGYRKTSKCNLVFYVFDILQINERSLINEKLIARKALLKEFITKYNFACIQFCDHIEFSGKALFAEVQRLELEGIVAKQATSKYRFGVRSKSWIKIKNFRTSNLHIIGFTKTKYNYIESLLVAFNNNRVFHYAGTVASGLDRKSSKALCQLLELHRGNPVIRLKEVPGVVIWTTTKFQCSVKYLEQTNDGLLRQPVFLRLLV